MHTIEERARRAMLKLSLMVAMAAAGSASTPAVADQCKLHKFAEFPITMVGLRPLMTAKINDSDVQLTVDSGAFYSTLTQASAAQLKLKTELTPLGFYVSGVHGNASVSSTIVKTFAVPGAALHNIEFLVAGGEIGYGSVGVLGQNFLHIADAEYDLGQGMIRLIKPEDCSKTVLAYWADASTPYSVLDLQTEPPLSRSSTGSRIPPKELQLSHIIGRASVNGVGITVWFDTGAATSILSTQAAARAGITPDSPGAVKSGSGSGIGKESFATYIVPVSSFKIGDEEIKRTRLRIGDIELPKADMLLGADFFLSHHIYVANSQKKLYFTFNGGAVFNLTAGSHPAGDAKVGTPPQEAGSTPSDTAPPSTAPSSTAPPSTPPTSTAPAPATAAVGEDAADFARRGAAFASRQEFPQALIALTRACELAPDNAGYAFQRGTVYWALKQMEAAKAEFDRALKLKPDDVQMLVTRAQVTVSNSDKSPAVADLDAADSIAPKQADIRFQMAGVYERAGGFAAAVRQLTLWIDSHSVDSRLPSALNSRCWMRALDNVDLPLALNDCNAALKSTDKSSSTYARRADSRALVYLRMGDYDRSIADYDAVLKIEPKNASALYGRGIDKVRKHETAAGNADIAAALSAWPKVAEQYNRRGISP